MRILKEGKKGQQSKGHNIKETTNEKAEIEDEHQDGLYIYWKSGKA